MNIIDSFFVALGFKIDDRDLSKFKGEIDKAKDSVLSLRDVIGGFITGGIGLMAKSFVDTSAQFEKFETILGVIEGSAEKGRQSMEWVSEFAAKTPYELDGVTDAFVKLRAYGMDPTNGLLTTLGDTAAAMGKPIMQAVEAIADAVTGENERLKEFGIKAKKTGDKIVYEYTQNGQTMTKTASASNRAQIQSTLEAIWNEKYAGSMDKLSSTWGGMWSNLMDNVTRFKKEVMGSGPFQQLKEGLGTLLELFNRAFETGAVKRFGQWFGIVFATMVKMIAMVAKSLDFVISRTVGWRTVMIAAAAIAVGIFASALASTTKLVWALARGIFAVNLAAAFWVVSVLAIAAAIALIVDDYQNWIAGNDSLIGELVETMPWVADLIAEIQRAVRQLVDFWTAQWEILGPPLTRLGEALWKLVSVIGEALWPVVKMLFSAWVSYLQWIVPHIVTVIEWLAVHWVGSIVSVINMFTSLASTVADVFSSVSGVIDTVRARVMGFVDMITGVIDKVRSLMSIAGVKSVISGVLEGVGLNKPTAEGGSANPAASGGVLGSVGNMSSTSSSSTSNQTSIQAPITIVTPDPAKAGEAIRNEFARISRQTTRNGQTAVAL